MVQTELLLKPHFEIQANSVPCPCCTVCITVMREGVSSSTCPSKGGSQEEVAGVLGRLQWSLCLRAHLSEVRPSLCECFTRKEELHNLSAPLPNCLLPGVLEENSLSSKIPLWEPFMSVYYKLPFLGLNAGLCRSWCRRRACWALPQSEGTDSRADGETREPGALPAAHTGAEMLPGSWSEPISPVQPWLNCIGFAVDPWKHKGCLGTPVGQLSSSRTQIGFSFC